MCFCVYAASILHVCRLFWRQAYWGRSPEATESCESPRNGYRNLNLGPQFVASALNFGVSLAVLLS